IDLSLISKRIAKDFAAYNLPYSICLFLGHLNNNGRLKYMSSNFPTPMFVSEGKLTALEDGPNPIIDGQDYDENLSFATKEIDLPKDQSLFIFTDGTYELVDQKSGGILGQNRFSRILKKCLTQD